MAEISGGTAYQKLQTPDNGVGQALQFWGAQDAKRVGDKKLADERAGIRKSEEIKAWEEATNLKEGDFKSKYTGFKSADDMYTDFSIYCTDEYVKTQRASKEAMLRGDNRGKAEAEGRMMKLKNYFGEVAKAQPRLAQISEAYQKAAQEGKVSGASRDFEDMMKSGLLDNNIAIREINGVLSYTGLTKEGKPIVVPYQDIMDATFGHTEKQDIDSDKGIVQNILGTLGNITKESQSGYYKISTQKWDDKIHGDAARKAIETLTSTDSVMSDLLYQSTKGKTIKRKDFTDEDYKLVSDNLEKRIYAGYNQKFGKEFNTGMYNADLDAKAAAARLKFDKDEANKPKTKEKTAEEVEYGSRRHNIELTTKGDISLFNQAGRTIEWGGSKVEVKGATRIGNNIVIRTDSTPITVPLNNSTAINDLFNAFEGKVTPFDKVMSVEANKWRDANITKESEVTTILEGQYSPTGKFIGEESDFIRSLKKLYPSVKTSEAGWLGKNIVVVNGEEIDLDNLSKDQVEQKVRQAVGEKPKAGANMTPEDYMEKYKNK
jgi:hypothetical protein